MDKGRFRRRYLLTGSSRTIFHDELCNCHKCMKLDKRKRKAEKRLGGLQDILLFCRVFPEGFDVFCGFRVNGWCAVFEDGCVRWNEFGDKLDYSVGKVNPFEVGE